MRGLASFSFSSAKPTFFSRGRELFVRDRIRASSLFGTASTSRKCVSVPERKGPFTSVSSLENTENTKGKCVPNFHEREVCSGQASSLFRTSELVVRTSSLSGQASIPNKELAPLRVQGSVSTACGTAEVFRKAGIV